MTKTKNVLSEEHKLAIGALAVAVSELDSILTDLIAAFLNINIVGAVIAVHRQQTAAKVDTLLAICDVALRGPDLKPIPDMFRQVRDLNDFRNTMVHAYWTIDKDGTAYAVRFDTRQKFSRSRNPYTAQEIQQRADEAAALALNLAGLRDHVRGEGGPVLPQEEPPYTRLTS